MSRVFAHAASLVIFGVLLSIVPPAASAMARDVPRQPARVLAHRSVRTYTVRRGDTLSKIARRYLGIARRWEGLYAANRDVIGRHPDAIAAGMTLRLVNKGLTANMARHIRRAEAPPPAPRPAVRASRQAVTPAASVTVPAAAPAAPAAPATYTGSGSMQQCIIARESGGNSQVMNSTGHYGLYQFDAGTWAANGGNPADFGNASVAEQNQVFANTVASSGYSAWTPYDGC